MLTDDDKRCLDVYIEVYSYIRSKLSDVVYNDCNNVALKLTELYFNDFIPDSLDEKE